MEKVDLKSQKDDDCLYQLEKPVKLQSWEKPTDIFKSLMPNMIIKVIFVTGINHLLILLYKKYW